MRDISYLVTSNTCKKEAMLKFATLPLLDGAKVQHLFNTVSAELCQINGKSDVTRCYIMVELSPMRRYQDQNLLTFTHC